MRTTPARRVGGSGAADTGDTAHPGCGGGADARAVGATAAAGTGRAGGAPTLVRTRRVGVLHGGRAAHRRGAAGLAVAAVLAAAAVAGCTSGTSRASGAAASPTATGTPGVASAPSSAGGSGSPSATGPGAPASASGGDGGGAPMCPGSSLRTGSASAGVASGHAGEVLTFTNTGSAACTLTGYPGAELTGVNGRLVMNATRTMSGYMGGAQDRSEPLLVTLAPGAVASALLEWATVPTGPGAPVGANCPGMGAEQLLVTPPDTTATVSLQPIGSACQDFEIHPVVSGATGRTSVS
jgi:hypothetical protein